jgi:hypothetical protein
MICKKSIYKISYLLQKILVEKECSCSPVATDVNLYRLKHAAYSCDLFLFIVRCSIPNPSNTSESAD